MSATYTKHFCCGTPTDAPHANDCFSRCHECKAVYSEKHKDDCVTAKNQREAAERFQDEVRERHRVEEADRGERIGTCDDEGVYIQGGDGPSPRILAFNQGGHDCTLVDLREVVEWVKRRRPELLR
jgi:hypothetical protein